MPDYIVDRILDPLPDGREYIINRELMRAATQELMGYALYSLALEGDSYHGQHKGVVETSEQAEQWIMGDDDVPKMIVHRRA